jgi:uncharacterized YccA/Bax inhibitor family protein
MEKAFRRFPEDYPPGRPYTAAGVYDKVAILVVLALVTGIYNYFAQNNVLVLVGIIGGFACALVGMFKPTAAKIAAPLYALLEGLALGGLTAYYATGDTGIVPMAIIFTGGIFVAALIVFRSGLVKVTPRFMAVTMIGLVGFVLVALAQAFGIASLNSPTEILVIGLIGVLLGTMMLFVDFNFIRQAEAAHLPAEAEWFGALMLMISLVFVYLNILRILARRR